MEQSSSFVQHQPFQLPLLRSKFQLDWLHQSDGKEDARTKRRRQDCGNIKAHSNELDFHCLDKFLIREPSDCVEKPGDTQRDLQGNLTRGEEEIQNLAQRRVLKEG